MSTQRLLIVEDNAVEAKLMEKIVTDHPQFDFQLSFATSLADALKTLENMSFQLVILDLTLPDSEGLETLEKVLKVASESAIVVSTGQDDETMALDALRMGAQDYFIKSDMEPKIFARILRYALERKKGTDALEQANQKMAEDETSLIEILKSLKKANNQLKLTQLQLIQAEKLEVVGRLAAGVAHEVKNPLAMVRMGVDFIKKSHPKLDEKVTFTLQTMNEAVEKADKIIRGMLDFSTLQSSDMTPQPIEAVIDKALMLLKHDIEKRNIKVTKDIAEKISHVWINANRMEQVFINLLTNSLRVIPERGKLDIRIFEEDIAAIGDGSGYRKEDKVTPGERVVIIEMRDNGPGFPEGMKEKLFDPFFTTHRTEGGSGLGLSIVKSIIHMHGGEISLDNCEEGGVCARIQLKRGEDE